MKKSKNLVSLLALVLLSFGVSHQSLANDQTIENANSYLGLNSIEKPKAEDTKQKIKNERSFLNINLIKVTCECEDKNKD